MPKPRDCVGKPVPAALTAPTYFTTAVLCDGRDVLGSCQLAVLNFWQVCACSTYSHCAQLCCVMVEVSLAGDPPSSSTCGRSVPAPLAVAASCVMVGMRLAAASWQPKNCLLHYSRSKRPILRGGSAVLEWAGSFHSILLHTVPYCSIPVPYPFQTQTSHGSPRTYLPGEQMADILSCMKQSVILCACVLGA